MARTTIVIPCYNEADRLDIRRFAEYVLNGPPCDFLFVNDGSTDNTLDVLHDLIRFDEEHFRLLNLERNVGKAEAVRRGVLLAMNDGAELVGYWDADLATPLDAIDEFCEYLTNHQDRQFVFGARVRLLGRAIRRNRVRHYIGRFFATVASNLLGLEIYDTQCGAKLFRATPTTQQLFAEPFISNWIFDVEIIARMICQEKAEQCEPVEQLIYELPLNDWYDVAGSKVRPRDFLNAFVELVKIYNNYLSPWAEPKIEQIENLQAAEKSQTDEQAAAKIDHSKEMVTH